MNNDSIIEAWNTVLFDKFIRFQHILVDGLSSHSNTLLERNIHHKGYRVLDVGCGFGDTTLKLAGMIGQNGEAIGVDCASKFIREAEAGKAELGLQNAKFVVADVQYDDLQGPYDYVFSRFGTMFFNLPGIAMKNINSSLKASGRLDMIVWRRREENPWIHDAELKVKEIVPVVSHEETDQVHCGPGPFSMASADMVSGMLKSAGFKRISFERNDAEICVGKNLDEAVSFAMELGPAGEIIRLAGENGENLRGTVRSALTETLGKYSRNDGVWAPSSTWFISATK